MYINILLFMLLKSEFKNVNLNSTKKVNLKKYTYKPMCLPVSRQPI